MAKTHPQVRQSAFQTIESFLATVKAGEANTEPGSQGGPTTHPIKNVPDDTRPATTGAAAAENARDVKEDQGPPAVDDTPVAKPGKSASLDSPVMPPTQPSAGGSGGGSEVLHQAHRAIEAAQSALSQAGAAIKQHPMMAAGIGAAGLGAAGVGAYLHNRSDTPKDASEANNGGTAEEDQYNIGLRTAPTGEDPSTETASTKAKKEDGQFQALSTHPARTDNDELNGGKYATDEELAKMPLAKIAGMIEELGNEICADMVNAKAAADAKPAQPQPRFPAQPAPQAPANTSKTAQQIDPAMAQQIGWEMAGLLNGTMDKNAVDRMVRNELETIIKAAEDDADSVARYLSEYHAEKAKQADASDANIAPPDAPAGGPPSASPPPDGGAGGPGGPGGPGGGSVDVQQIIALCQQMGITPEELTAALSEVSGGAGAPGGDPSGAPGGAPGGAGPTAGAGPMAAMAAAGPGGGAAGPPPGAPGMEATAGDKHRINKEAANYIAEIVSRSRAKKAAAERKPAA